MDYDGYSNMVMQFAFLGGFVIVSPTERAAQPHIFQSGWVWFGLLSHLRVCLADSCLYV